MCITVKENCISISDNHDITRDSGNSYEPKTLREWVKATKEIHGVDEVPAEWKEHIMKKEFCAALKDAVNNAVDIRSRGDKNGFKDSLIDLIKVSLMTYNNIV